MLEQACPILPSRDFDATAAFYEGLGFETFRHVDAYLIATRDRIELHFFAAPHREAETCDHGAYLRPADVDALSRDWAGRGLPTAGLPRFAPAEDKPWGMREATLWDPDGNLLRVGQEVR